MIKAWSDEAWEDFEYWMKQDKKTLKRILQLLKDIERNGYDGIGKPERLSGDLSAWLDFVLMCRNKGGMPHDYDMVVGATADDDTALCLKVYEEGAYGEKGSDQAKQILLNNLEVENLGVQYYIGKQEVADAVIKSIREIDWR